MIIEIVEELDDMYFRHVKNIAKHLRQADYDELSATGVIPQDDVMKGYMTSKRKWIVIRQEGSRYMPIAIFGVSERDDGVGVPWMVATNGLKKIKVFLIKNCKRYINIMLGMFGKLYNIVDTRNTESIEWLKWCGFEFDAPVLIGKDKLPFYPFHMRSEINV